MARSKIEDEAEVVRWYDEERTFAWMAQEYARKYGVSVVPSTFSNLIARRGLARRTVKDVTLMPWAVKREHRWAYDAAMLRMEARRRAGTTLSHHDAGRLALWRARLVDADLVVHYDPDTVEGWHYVPRREGIDLDLIRVPDAVTTERPSRDA